MTITFSIHYHTQWGQRILLAGDLGKNMIPTDSPNGIPLIHKGGGNWELNLKIEKGQLESFAYNYYLQDESTGRCDKEWGTPRKIDLDFARFDTVLIRDYWRSRNNPAYALLSSAFTRALMPKQAGAKVSLAASPHILSFRLLASRLPKGAAFCILGNIEALGAWEEDKALLMSGQNFPVWEVEIPLQKNSQDIAYKYGIFDLETHKVISWEQGENRLIRVIPYEEKELFVQQDEEFRYEEAKWRGTGVALPVFSLRSKKSWGVGDFDDLKLLVDWAHQSNQNLVQILPINDTIATHTWVDSYPYAAISVYAFHPMYLSPEKMGTLEDQKFWEAFKQKAEKLNELPEIDYEEVMKLKSRFIKLLYHQEKDNLKKDKDFKKFVTDNKSWLHPYAVFSYLRDVNQEVNFHEWKNYSVYNPKQIEAFAKPGHKAYDEIAIHYFIQYHLHLQLSEAALYARKHAVVLKGDIPIGIYRYSVDAWMFPHLFNMDAQAGAPPDDFAVEGQNWGFPTYNWEEMAKNDYEWWRTRLSHTARYFDAYRIDHILGFFRIWQVPYSQIQGLMGIFNPSLPYSLDELLLTGLIFDEDRFCAPFITEDLLETYFGENKEKVKAEFLRVNEKFPGNFLFKANLQTQREIQAYLVSKKESDYYSSIDSGLKNLLGEFLFHRVKEEEKTYYHPKISLHHTHSFKMLDEHQQHILKGIYTNYFYHRHDEFWKNQALIKLPAIVDATEMLVCGEDLGMVPDSVPSVMHELGLLSLEIQRMPKESDREFGNLEEANYLSVVSPSSHDMSPIRAWWEEDPEITQKFYEQKLHREGWAPFYCEPDICKQILQQHLESPAMWAIFPLQDLLSIDPKLRREKPLEERINVPANPTHYWRYRFHIPLEDLLNEDSFNEEIREMIDQAGRNQAY